MSSHEAHKARPVSSSSCCASKLAFRPHARSACLTRGAASQAPRGASRARFEASARVGCVSCFAGHRPERAELARRPFREAIFYLIRLLSTAATAAAKAAGAFEGTPLATILLGAAGNGPLVSWASIDAA